jgi:hypothetical protein
MSVAHRSNHSIWPKNPEANRIDADELLRMREIGAPEQPDTALRLSAHLSLKMWFGDDF